MNRKREKPPRIPWVVTRDIEEQILAGMTESYRVWIRTTHKSHHLWPFFFELGPRRIAEITTASILSNVIAAWKPIVLYSKIGEAFRTEVRKHPSLADVWREQDMARYGVVAGMLWRDATGLIEHTKVWGRAVVALSEDGAALLEDALRRHSHTGVMADPPPVTIHEPKNPRPATKVGPAAQEAVTRLQGIAWRNNARIVSVLHEAFTHSLALPGCGGGRKPEIFPKEVDKEENYLSLTALNVWKRERLRLSEVVLMTKHRLPRFWWSWTVDHRGRMYARARGVSNQGSDLGRATVEFADGVRIGDGDYHLAHHGANMWGVRGPYEIRERWIREHRPAILACAADPIGESFWHGAAEPWRFLAFCFEWACFLRDGRDHVTHLPCQIDGTSNAFQLAALLMRDRELARGVNLTEESGDFYLALVDRVIARLHEDKKFGPGWLDLMRGPGARKWVKLACIPLFYTGGSVFATSRDIGTKLRATNFFNQRIFGGLRQKAGLAFAQYVREALGEDLGRFTALTNWLQQTVKRAALARGPVSLPWHAPGGFVIDMREPLVRTRKVVGMKLYETLHDTPCPQRSAGRAVLNVIHGLDGAIAARVVNTCPFDVTTIHDCFGALAPHMPVLHRRVREAVVHIFDPNPILGLPEAIGDPDPQPLPQGDYDPKEILDAPYAYT